MSFFNKVRRSLASKIDPTTRVEGAFGRLSTEAGLSPLYKDRTVEVRRKELIDAMTEINQLEFDVLAFRNNLQKKVNLTEDSDIIVKAEMVSRIQDHNFKSFKLARMFQLFFITGDPWIRGLDNGKLSICVSAFIEQYEDVGHLSGFLNMLTSEAFELIHLAWQAIDVDVLPPMLLSSQPLLINQTMGGAMPRYGNPRGAMGEKENQ